MLRGGGGGNRAQELAGEGLLAGERLCVRIPGFDLGNSPREFLDPAGETVILTTTNGTRALVTAGERCERVLAGSLLNLGHSSPRRGTEAATCPSSVPASRASSRWTTPTSPDASRACSAEIRPTPPLPPCGSVRRSEWEEGLGASQSARNLVAADLADDIAWCARESVLDVVPRLGRMVGTAVELVA